MKQCGDNLIVDAHVHVTEDGRWFQTRHDASLTNLISEMNRSNIDKAVVLPISPIIPNEFIHQICTHNSDRLIGFASVNPLRPRASDKLRNEIKKYNLKGLKLHQNVQKFDFNEEGFKSVLNMASNLEIPLIIDTWFNDDNENNRFYTMIEDVIESIPDLIIILPHLGGKDPGNISRFKEFHKVFFDLSFVLTRIGREITSEMIETRLSEIGARKLIYGSDFPEINPSLYLENSRKILNKFSSFGKELIFSKNILKICNM